MLGRILFERRQEAKEQYEEKETILGNFEGGNVLNIHP